VIRSLYAAKGFEGAKEGIVISSTGFTSDARVCAKDSGIALMDVCSLMPIGLEHGYEAIFFCEEKDIEHMEDVTKARVFILRMKASILSPRMELSVDRGGFMPLKDDMCIIATKRPHTFMIRTSMGTTFRFAPRTSKDRLEMDISVRNGRPHIHCECERYRSPVSVNHLQ